MEGVNLAKAKVDKYAGTMKRQKFTTVIKRIWKMAAPYWTKSEEKWASLALLVVSLLMMVLNTMVSRRMVIWNKDWMNAFNNRDSQLWLQQIGVFLIVGLAGFDHSAVFREYALYLLFTKELIKIVFNTYPVFS